MDAETSAAAPGGASGGRTGAVASVGEPGSTNSGVTSAEPEAAAAPLPRRFYGSVQLDPARVGRDASRIADEVIAHLAGQVGADVTVTLEIAVSLPGGASDQVVRTVTENSRTLKFTSHEFESE